jgi:hypothetical protein
VDLDTHGGSAQRAEGVGGSVQEDDTAGEKVDHCYWTHSAIILLMTNDMCNLSTVAVVMERPITCYGCACIAANRATY